MSTTRVQVQMERGEDGRLIRPILVLYDGGKKGRFDGLDIVGPSRLRMLPGNAGVALFTESEVNGVHDPNLMEGE